MIDKRPPIFSLSLSLSFFLVLYFLHFAPHLLKTFVLLAELQTICSAYWNRLYALEGDKFDLERQIRLKEFEVNTTWLA